MFKTKLFCFIPKTVAEVGSKTEVGFRLQPTGPLGFWSLHELYVYGIYFISHEKTGTGLEKNIWRYPGQHGLDLALSRTERG